MTVFIASFIGFAAGYIVGNLKKPQIGKPRDDREDIVNRLARDN